VLAAVGYMAYAGVTHSSVYFVTPAEFTAAPVADKPYRVGGLVAPGSVHWTPETLELTFTLTDSKSSVPVRHEGRPPDMFGEGRGAIIEGRWSAEGYFSASTILAKHSEEYRPSEPASPGTRPASPRSH
jgi:cytochrome c-type biogenesis protein CcmE